MEDPKVIFLTKKAKRLVLLNKVATFFAIVWSIYLIAFPFFPNLTLALSYRDSSGDIPEFVQDAIEDDPKKDRLIIPSIGVNQTIIESESIKGVGDYVWRRPKTSIPSTGSNTVLVAHRYRSIGGERSSTFYHLPKMLEGDRSFVYYDGVLYEYKVVGTDIVLPTEVSIEEPTDIPMLTMYTCTPLYTSTHRHVIKSILVKTTKIQ